MFYLRTFYRQETVALAAAVAFCCSATVVVAATPKGACAAAGCRPAPPSTMSANIMTRFRFSTSRQSPCAFVFINISTGSLSAMLFCGAKPHWKCVPSCSDTKEVEFESKLCWNQDITVQFRCKG
jgi:hypothetical protein